MSFENNSGGSGGGGDPEVSRIFSQKVDRRFQRDFGRLVHHQQQQQNEQGGKQQQRKTTREASDQHLQVKLIEAREEVEKLRRHLSASNEEVERVKATGIAERERADGLQRELSELRMRVEREKRKSRDFTDSKVEERLMLDDYRGALSKYRTWMQFADRQMVTMKTLLEEVGAWNETNRYKIYFAYRAIQPELVTDDKVAELSSGSIMDYPSAVEQVEGITSTQTRPKFHSAQTQTEGEEGSLAMGSSLSSHPSQSLLDKSFIEETPHQQPSNERMSAQEMRLLELEQQVEELEIQGAHQREQLITLGDRAKHVELLEEQKRDLQLQVHILRQQNDRLIRDHELLKTAFGGGSITRNALEELVRAAEQLKTRNQELEQKLRQLEMASKDKGGENSGGIGMAESRRIARMFKEKYERELLELRARLDKYEPLHPSETTRVLRFAQHNPLDEAHDEHLVKQAAAAATSSSGGVGNPLKRRKMDDFDISTDSDMTFLAEEQEQADPVQLRELRLQLANVKQQLEQSERAHVDFQAQYHELVTQLCGYDIRLCEDGFCEAETVLPNGSNREADCFLFRKHPPVDVGGPGPVDLLESDSTRRWRDVMENYLVRYQSVPAFLSAVTISLVESPGTPMGGSTLRSSSRSSSLVIEGEEEEEGRAEEAAGTSSALGQQHRAEGGRKKGGGGQEEE